MLKVVGIIVCIALLLSCFVPFFGGVMGFTMYGTFYHEEVKEDFLQGGYGWSVFFIIITIIGFIISNYYLIVVSHSIFTLFFVIRIIEILNYITQIKKNATNIYEITSADTLRFLPGMYLLFILIIVQFVISLEFKKKRITNLEKEEIHIHPKIRNLPSNTTDVKYDKARLKRCSNCGSIVDNNNSFCPKCGSKMHRTHDSGEESRAGGDNS